MYGLGEEDGTKSIALLWVDRDGELRSHGLNGSFYALAVTEALARFEGMTKLVLSVWFKDGSVTEWFWSR